ncbi:hypothetical protein BDL97_10G098200 [Sphagnum fallax]|nr:hypothetical protein BDL97_10G098200 [Sphagnum fallax]
MMFAFKRHITEWRLVILQAQEKIFVLQMKQPWRNLIGNSIQNQASRLHLRGDSSITYNATYIHFILNMKNSLAAYVAAF